MAVYNFNQRSSLTGHFHCEIEGVKTKRGYQVNLRTCRVRCKIVWRRHIKRTKYSPSKYFIAYALQQLGFIFIGCVPLRWSGSGLVIRDQSDHCASKEPANPLLARIHRFLWCTVIFTVISDHWCYFGSSQRNAPIVFFAVLVWALHKPLPTAANETILYIRQILDSSAWNFVWRTKWKN